MFKRYKQREKLIDCLWKIEKDLHTIASSMRSSKKQKVYSVRTGKEIKQ